MYNLLIYYSGGRNEFLEKRIIQLCENYQGQVVQEFYFNNGSFEWLFSFKSIDQENNFRKDIIIVSKRFNLDINFGGSIHLL